MWRTAVQTVCVLTCWSRSLLPRSLPYCSGEGITSWVEGLCHRAWRGSTNSTCRSTPTLTVCYNSNFSLIVEYFGKDYAVVSECVQDQKLSLCNFSFSFSMYNNYTIWVTRVINAMDIKKLLSFGLWYFFTTNNGGQSPSRLEFVKQLPLL